MLDSLLNWDTELFLLINEAIANPVFDWAMPIIRNKYIWFPLYLFILSFVLFNFKKKVWFFLLFAIVTISLADTLSSKVIKPSVQRIRPCNDLHLSSVVERVPCGSGYSFTSSHATNHFAVGTYFMMTLGFLMGRWRYSFLVWAGLIGFAQIYVGVHYPLDVLGGALAGILCGLITAYLYALLLGSHQLKYSNGVA